MWIACEKCVTILGNRVAHPAPPDGESERTRGLRAPGATRLPTQLYTGSSLTVVPPRSEPGEQVEGNATGKREARGEHRPAFGEAFCRRLFD